PDVWFAEDRQAEAVLQDGAVIESLLDAGQSQNNRFQRFRQKIVRRNIDVVFGKIDSGFQSRDDVHQFVFNWLESLRQRTFHLRQRSLCLAFRLGLDKIPDGLGLNE